MNRLKRPNYRSQLAALRKCHNHIARGPLKRIQLFQASGSTDAADAVSEDRAFDSCVSEARSCAGALY